MSRLGVFILTCFGAGLFAQSAWSASGNVPDFKETYSLIESNLPAGLTRAELNAIAVTSLLKALEPKVGLLTGTNATQERSAISKAEMIHGSFAYVRIGAVNNNLPELLENRFKQLGSTNKLEGIVLDLRYTGGGDYKAAAAVADLFVGEDRALLDTGTSMLKTVSAGAVISVPAAVLINGSTEGAAEALAAVLRDTGSALLLGNRSAGQAALGREFKLSSGQTLRINIQPVRLPKGSVIAESGLRPDITIDLPPEEEKRYYADPYAVLQSTNQTAGEPTLGASNTNRPGRRVRFNEADLVREHTGSERARRSEEETLAPSISDPALARALDVLKGLSVVRRKGS